MNAFSGSISPLLVRAGRNAKLVNTSRHAFIGCRLNKGRLRTVSHASSVSPCSNSTGLFVRRTKGIFTLVLMAASSVVAFQNTNDQSATTSCSSEAIEDKQDGLQTLTTQPFPDAILQHDHYNGVTLHLNRLGENEFPAYITDQIQFASSLEKALKIWREEGRRGIWIHVPHRFASVVPKCVEAGFNFHFCNNGNLVLSQWLPQDTPSKLPLGPHTQAGVGALVLHPDDPSLMLVVQEKTGPAAARKLWKMPTGLLDPGEDIHDGAERELQEETGLKASFQGILCFRQAHSLRQMSRATSDLFFVCLLKLPASASLDEIKAQEDEILDIRWMPIEEYAAQSTWQKSPVYKELNKSIIDGINNKSYMINKTLPLGFVSGATNSVYRSSL